MNLIDSSAWLEYFTDGRNASQQQGTVIELTSEIAIQASKVSLEYHLTMANSIILATAYLHNAILWTQDDDFSSIYGVQYFSKKSTS